MKLTTQVLPLGYNYDDFKWLIWNILIDIMANQWQSNLYKDLKVWFVIITYAVSSCLRNQWSFRHVCCNCCNIAWNHVNMTNIYSCCMYCISEVDIPIWYWSVMILIYRWRDVKSIVQIQFQITLQFVNISRLGMLLQIIIRSFTLCKLGWASVMSSLNMVETPRCRNSLL